MLPTNMQMLIWCICLLTNMQMQIFIMQISHYKNANTTSPWCKFSMQGCECKVYLWWYQCPLAEMWMQIFIFRYKNAPCGYVMMWMPPCGCVMVQMSHCGYVMMQMLFTWHKCNLTKNFFYFQIETSSKLRT